MWDEEEVAPLRRVPLIPLEPMGVAELRAYTDELRAEIARVEVAITRKQQHRGAADSFFRVP